MIHFTSDQHYGGEFIRDLYKRPFDTIIDMDRELIKRHNEKVKQEDTVIIVGDFRHDDEKTLNTFDYYAKQLNGNKIYIGGNHDPLMLLHFMVVNVPNNGEVFVVHDPEGVMVKYPINIVGHIHNKWRINKQGDTWVVNVSVEMWNYYPASIEDILKAVNAARSNP